MNKNFIGLDKDKSDTTIKNLNSLLCNLQVYYQNLKVLHWNIEGKNFFDLHGVFGEYYTTTAENIDAVAERILMLGGRPTGSFKDYLLGSKIDAIDVVTNDTEAVGIVLANLGTLVTLEREILAMTDGTDEGTFSIMSAISGCHEKSMWMLNAYLS
jgi:starvation-inducible DNA-binding protein